jgi:hypothetical protein
MTQPGNTVPWAGSTWSKQAIWRRTSAPGSPGPVTKYTPRSAQRPLLMIDFGSTYDEPLPQEFPPGVAPRRAHAAAVRQRVAVDPDVPRNRFSCSDVRRCGRHGRPIPRRHPHGHPAPGGMVHIPSSWPSPCAATAPRPPGRCGPAPCPTWSRSSPPGPHRGRRPALRPGTATPNR